MPTAAERLAYIASMEAATTPPPGLKSLDGIYLPPNWGQFWKPKRNAAGSAIARVGVVADSIGLGFWASDLETKSWVGLLAAALQAKFGDGGSGFKTASKSSPGFLNAAIPQATIDAYAAKPNNLIGVTGPWTYNTGGAGWGAGGGVATIVAGNAGSKLTFSVRGTKVSVFALSSPGTGTLGIKIDNVAQTSIPTAGAAGTIRTDYNVGSGVHTVEITADAAACWVSGVSGENATGVVVHNYSAQSAMSGWFSTTGNTAGAYGPSAAWSGGNKNPVDLLIYGLGLNDANAGQTGDLFAQAVRRNLLQVRNAGTSRGATDILYVIPHLGNYDTTNEKYQDMTNRIRTIAASAGAAVIDFWALGRNSYNWMTDQGYIGKNDGTGGAGADVVHLSDAGHAWMFNGVLPILTS